MKPLFFAIALSILPIHPDETPIRPKSDALVMYEAKAGHVRRAVRQFETANSQLGEDHPVTRATHNAAAVASKEFLRYHPMPFSLLGP